MDQPIHAANGVDSSGFLPSLGGPATLAIGRRSGICSCIGKWPSVRGWVPSGLCLLTRSYMCDPKTCLECSFTYFLYPASQGMAAPQAAQPQVAQQMHTHA